MGVGKQVETGEGEEKTKRRIMISGTRMLNKTYWPSNLEYHHYEARKEDIIRES